MLTAQPASAQGNTRYPDVPADTYYSAPVTHLHARGLFAGTECDEGFCPGEPIDRATMAVWLVRILDGSDPPPVTAPRFADVDASHPRAAFIERLADLGVTGGCGDGTNFCPDRSVTRAQMAAFLSRAYDLPAGPDPGFSDVPDDAWYAAAVTRLAASGITGGCGDGTSFCPGRETTRAQMATFLWRAENRDDTGGDGVDDGRIGGDIVGGELPSSDDPDQPAPLVERHIEGHWSVPVYICGPTEKYAEEDVQELTADLNLQMNGVFERASSQRVSMVFNEGDVLSPDLDWTDASAENTLMIQSACVEEMLASSSTSQTLMQISVDRLQSGDKKAAGLGAYGAWALVASREKIVRDSSASRWFRFVAEHELGHSILQLNHLKLLEIGPIYLDQYRLSVPPFRLPILACYQYDQLGWPVPDYAKPCMRLAPSKPESIGLRYTDDDRVALTWRTPLFSDNAPITGYTVSISRQVDIRYELVSSFEVGPHIKSLTFDNPRVPGTYELSIRANSRYGAGDSHRGSAWLHPVPPLPEGVAVPVGLGSVTNTRISLEWDGSNARDFVNPAYQVQYSGAGTTVTRDGALNGVHLDGLEPGTEYSIRVRSCSEGSWWNCGDWGPALKVSTRAELPPPRPVRALTGRDWYLLSWEPVEGAVTYQIELPDGAWTSTYTPDYAVAHGVLPSTAYTLRVASCDQAHLCDWEIDWTEITFSTTSEQKPPPPYRISLQEVGDSWVELAWDYVLDGRSYRVEYEYTDGTTGSGLREAASLPLRISTQPNKTYQFKARSCPTSPSDASCSVWSDFEFSTAPLSSSVQAPTVNLIDTGDIWLDFSWDPVAGASSYSWRYKHIGEVEWRAEGSVARPYLRLDNRLEPNSTYILEVRTCGATTAPCSDWASVTATTVQSFPLAPSFYAVSIARTTGNEIHLEWDPPTSLTIVYDVRFYPTADKGRTAVRWRSFMDDAVLTNLRPDTAYTLQIRTCEVDVDSGGLNCDGRVTIEASTRPSN